MASYFKVVLVFSVMLGNVWAGFREGPQFKKNLELFRTLGMLRKMLRYA